MDVTFHYCVNAYIIIYIFNNIYSVYFVNNTSNNTHTLKFKGRQAKRGSATYFAYYNVIYLHVVGGL